MQTFESRIVVGDNIEIFKNAIRKIIQYFGKEWLECPGDHPLQKLWIRNDSLAGSEY